MNTQTEEAAEKLKNIIYGNGRVSWNTAEKIATDILTQSQLPEQEQEGKAVGDAEIEIGTMWCEVVFAVLQADKAGKEVGEFIPTELESKFTIKRK